MDSGRELARETWGSSEISIETSELNSSPVIWSR